MKSKVHRFYFRYVNIVEVVLFAKFNSKCCVTCLFQERRGFLVPWIVITIIMIVFAAFGVIAACTEISMLKPSFVALFLSFFLRV